MLAIAGAMALLLGIIGIYGVIAYSVSQRTREIGIRMALGVEQRDLRRMFLRHGLVLSAIGVVVGIGVAAALMRLMTSMLFQVSPLDVTTYAGRVCRAARGGDARQLSAGASRGVAEPGRGAARGIANRVARRLKRAGWSLRSTIGTSARPADRVRRGPQARAARADPAG